MLVSQVAEQGDEAVVSAFYTLANTAFAVFFLPIGAMIGATSIVALRTKALPVWFGVAGGVAAIAEIALAGTSTSISGPFSVTGALSSAGLLLFGIWLATTSILLIQRVGRRPSAAWCEMGRLELPRPPGHRILRLLGLPWLICRPGSVLQAPEQQEGHHRCFPLHFDRPAGATSVPVAEQFVC